MDAHFFVDAGGDGNRRGCRHRYQTHDSRARPSVKTEIRWGGPRFSTKYHAFPSGHVVASTAFFGVLVFARRRVGLACLPIPILIGLSRNVLSARITLSDVVCAAVLGILCAGVVWRFVAHRSSNHQAVITVQRSHQYPPDLSLETGEVSSPSSRNQSLVTNHRSPKISMVSVAAWGDVLVWVEILVWE